MLKMLTIVICTYNGELYLSEVIESVLSQSGFSEFVDSIKIVDNASTDSTKDIILRYSKVNNSIEYIYEENPGLTHARKHAALVNTEWVAYLDDDNILLPNWIMNAVQFLQKSPNVGVLNGAIIATVREEINQENENMLHAIYRDLACTHASLEEYNNDIVPIVKMPVGAGMILRVEPLRRYLNRGWTNNIGRKGNDLGSGEDGEIANSILEEGYDFAYNNDMALLHIIPLKRLQPEYVMKLSEGLIDGYYTYLKSKNNSLFYITRSFIKSLVVIVKNPILLIITTNKVKKIKIKRELQNRIQLCKKIITGVFTKH